MPNSTRSTKRSKIMIPFHTGTTAELYAPEDTVFTQNISHSSATSTTTSIASSATTTSPMDMARPSRDQPHLTTASLSLPSSMYGITGGNDGHITGYSSADSIMDFSSSSPEETTPPPKKRRVKRESPSEGSHYHHHHSQQDSLDRDGKKGERWTPEEETKLWELRTTAEPESWDLTSKQFVGRSTNALQKKFKLMCSAHKMKMEPEFQSLLISAILKHRDPFLQSVAAELKMEGEDALEQVEEKISTLYIQGKLPLTLANMANNMRLDDQASSSISPMLQHARPATAPSHQAFRPRVYSQPETSIPYSLAKFTPNNTITQDSPSSLSPIESPVLNSAYPSDSEGRYGYHHQDGTQTHNHNHHHHAMDVFDPSSCHVPFTDYSIWTESNMFEAKPDQKVYCLPQYEDDYYTGRFG